MDGDETVSEYPAGLGYLARGKPFFDITLTHSHVTWPQLDLPARVVKLFPEKAVEVELRHNTGKWMTGYNGDPQRPKFDTRWREFVKDNHLEEGDALVFNRVACSSELVVFNVHILRDALPPELAARLAKVGESSEKPMVID